MEQMHLDPNRLLNEILDLKQKLQDLLDSRISTDWLPRKQVMQFFNYGETQMAALLRSPQLRVRTIGKRKFIHKDSISNLLNAAADE
ncbi:MAG: hypothetical protein EOO15_02980 [Chitinophagaceae bacterium]|nr:MAG: hypothetical protein EOO15_02980 [Chitinophagaceae bacterium]